MLPENTVVVETFTKAFEAEVARDFLNNEGFQAVILKDDAGGMDPQMQLTRGVHLVVHQQDAQEALELLQARNFASHAPVPTKEVTPEALAKTWQHISFVLLILGTVILAVGLIVKWKSEESGIIPMALGGALTSLGLLAQWYLAYKKSRVSNQQTKSAQNAD